MSFCLQTFLYSFCFYFILIVVYVSLIVYFCYFLYLSVKILEFLLLGQWLTLNPKVAMHTFLTEYHGVPWCQTGRCWPSTTPIHTQLQTIPEITIWWSQQNHIICNKQRYSPKTMILDTHWECAWLSAEDADTALTSIIQGQHGS